MHAVSVCNDVAGNHICRKCIGLRGLRKYLFLATQAQQLNKECERCSYYYLDDG